ncbi:MAG: hypothetical protein CMJ84_02415 [Planctomycetes bacterium]|jgi:hypothetical protein|nr:hypothetical protein [Planctomycetota bacterium]MDP6408408.1 L-2-amino-thiazoline-4-carboxylic acid hydrolase [Planctomycetota bacterium]
MPPATLGPLSLLRASWFDLRHGLPIALRALARRFGLLGTVGILARVARRRLLADPLAGLPAGSLGAVEERLTRRQLRGLFLLDDVLERELDLPVAERLALLKPIVGEAGARFIAQGAKISAARWRAATDAERRGDAVKAMAHFPNARTVLRLATEDALEFDVTYCRLAEACLDTGREHLAPLFCHADALYFDGRGGRPSLEREETIAAGDPRCAFRLHLPSP